MSEILEGDVGDEIGILKRKICDGGFIVSCEPVSDGLSFIGLSIGSNDRVLHLSLGDGAGPFLFETSDEVVVLVIHLNNNYKVYQIKLSIYMCSMPYHTRDMYLFISFYTTLDKWR